jgi:hypothetical protein
MAYVYRHIRLDKNEPFYIGIGSDEEYKRASTPKNRNIFWKRVVNKTEFEVEILYDNLNWDEACIKEKEFISLYGRKDKNKGSLCNLTDGGEGSVGVIVSEYGRKQRSDFMKTRINKPITEETRFKLSLSHKGKPLSDEHKLRISIANKGKIKSKMTDEHKKKLSLVNLGKKQLDSTIKKRVAKLIGQKRTPEAIEKMSKARILYYKNKKENYDSIIRDKH